MPKTFSEHERAYIKKRLIEEAEVCLGIYGVKKTTVDELVKRVNIPKGTFYLFYESKELLFFDVINKYHHQKNAEISKRLDDMKEPLSPESLTELIFQMYQSVFSSFIYQLIKANELELIIRKLPQKVTLDHINNDDFNVEILLKQIPGADPTKISTYSAALRAVFLAMLNKQEIGEDHFNDVIRLMIRGIVIQIFRGE